MKGKRPGTAGTIAAVAVVAAVAAAVWWLQQPAESESQWTLIQDYCTDCHNNAEFSGDISFEGLTAGDIAGHAETFETAVRKLRGDLMPPPGNPRPDRSQMEALIGWLEVSLDASFDETADMPRAGHVPLQRMSRREYASTVTDLLAVDIDPAEYLPTDMEIDGFTNMAEALSVSPAFLEQYVSVARAVARIAVGQNSPKLASSFYEPPRTTASQDYHEENLPPGTRGGTSFVHNFPADGEYHLSMADLDFGVYPRGLETEQTLVMLIDRVEVFRRQLGGMDELMLVNREGAAGRAELMAGFTNIPINVTAGDPPASDTRVAAFRTDNRDEFAGLAKIDMETGRIDHIYKGRAPGNGAVLATAGGLVFWGDLDRRLRAFDADEGTILWETVLGGAVQMSTITYSVDGRQYVAVYTGEGLLTSNLISWAEISPPRGHNAVYVFALPN